MWVDSGIGSVLMIGYSSRAGPPVCSGIASARPRDNWEVQLHLLMKLVGSSLATGLERIEIQRASARISRSATSSRSTAPTTACGISTRSTTAFTCRRAGRPCSATTRADVGQAPDWRTLVHSDDMSRVQAAIRDHVAGKTPIFESLHRMRHATGEWRWVISRAKAKVDDKGRLLRLVGVELDITERKLYEEALFREKESAQITLQSIGDGVITTDAKGVIDYVNPVAEALTGWRLEDSQGRAIEEIFRAFHEETCEPLENPAGGRDPPHPLDQIGAPDAAHPPRRQRNLRREHGLAHPRRQRRGLGRRAGVPRRQRGARTQPAPLAITPATTCSPGW